MMERIAGMRGKGAARKVDMPTLGGYLRTSSVSLPRSYDVSAEIPDYSIAMNDVLGTSVLASVVHALQLAYNEIGEYFPTPSAWEIESAYSELDKNDDGNISIADALDYWMEHGLFGTKISAYVPVDITNRREMSRACFEFGTIILGAEMPENAEEQFNAGEPFYLSEMESPRAQGHAMVATGYSRFGIDVITWGSTESLTWSWWERYGSEAWVVIPEFLIEIYEDSAWGLDILTIQKDIHSARLSGNQQR
jgi:hypothetical protein